MQWWLSEKVTFLNLHKTAIWRLCYNHFDIFDDKYVFVYIGEGMVWKHLDINLFFVQGFVAHLLSYANFND